MVIKEPRIKDLHHRLTYQKAQEEGDTFQEVAAKEMLLISVKVIDNVQACTHTTSVVDSPRRVMSIASFAIVASLITSRTTSIA